MAAEPQPDWLSCLPPFWSYGVTQDGRVFFINEEAKSTTWLQPVSGEAVITGHRKTPDLPTGWEEGYTFEGARCFINHNERKVTCKHPVSGAPSQDNCIFVVNEHVKYGKLVHPDQPLEADIRTAPKSEQDSSANKKERPVSTMSEASNYTGGSDNSNFTGSPAATVTLSSSFTRPSRSSKKVHNFGKRSNSIKRNINAPVVKSNWLYKQDSTGMKLWKKRWFVLSDLCLFYYRDEKEDSILGSILLPSFHISMLSVDDHISRKYAFKATHPNMRTYYFCTDTAKEMESWMKVMTDAALVHGGPAKNPALTAGKCPQIDTSDMSKGDQPTPQELNNVLNNRLFSRPEVQNNERNREPVRQHSLSRTDAKQPRDADKLHGEKEREYYTFQKDGGRYCLKQDCVSYMLQKDGEKYLLHKGGEKYMLQKDGEKYSIHRDLENCSVEKADGKYRATPTDEKRGPTKDGEKYFRPKDEEKLLLQKMGVTPTLVKDNQKYVPQREVRRQLSLKETQSKYGTIQIVDKYNTLKDVRKYSTLREGDKYATLRDLEKYATLCHGDKNRFQKDPSAASSHAKISDINLQPAQAAAIAAAAAAVAASRRGQAALAVPKPAQVNGSGSADHKSDYGSAADNENQARVPAAPVQEQERGLCRTNSIQQVERIARSHKPKGTEEDRSVSSYQTLPRNMPSHHPQLVPRYPEGYRTLPRNSMMRPDSICSVAGSAYDRALRPVSTGAVTAAEKRKSMRDDTMWQLYEWQQRQAFSRQSLAQPAAGHYGTLPSTKTMGNISEHAAVHSVLTSPSHGSLALYNTLPPPSQQGVTTPGGSHSEASPPIFREDGTLDRLHRTHPAKFGSTLDRRPMPAGVPPQPITAQSLQGKTPEELTLMLIKLRRQQAELNSLREHTISQLVALGVEGPNPKTDVLSHHLQRNLVYLDNQKKENEPLIFTIHTMIENSAPRPQLYQQITPDEYQDCPAIQPADDIDTKLSRFCEQDKVVRMQEEKLQQLHREKHTLETALLSASQELSGQSSPSTSSTQSLVQQRDVLQNGLLSTCRELSRVTTELERSWREYDRMEGDVTLAKSNLLEELEALGSPQTEPPSEQHIQIQKELWRIQDVMEALSKSKPQRSMDGCSDSKPLSSLQKSEGPDYRLYKSEPELTTVKEEADEVNVEDKEKDKNETAGENTDVVASKAPLYPVGLVPPRTKSSAIPPESTTIASYVTLRKTKKTESRSDRPRSVLVDPTGYGEREVGRPRMSVEEQMERMRRHQEASSQREKRREALSRSHSFSKDDPFVMLQVQTHAAGTCADPLELEAALKQVKTFRRTEPEAGSTTSQEAREEEASRGKGGYSPQDETDDAESELCEVQTAVILDQHTETQHVEIVNLHAFEDLKSTEDVTTSPTNITTENSFQSSYPETPSPEPKEGELDVLQQNAGEENLEKHLESYNRFPADDKKHNNNNLLASPLFTLLSNDT
ncbi:pleckstrin homology domain-containing family A member 5-like isoform X3 [Syngnathoides biaculeatus]|uniref:pleckstrin homology domain-containing family A member 5-like isoform X3 n=1 Tax=Syngnathoides biaculeatus TaxID=300417 RepID=UPI002ADE2ACD|nr:pleckstrin homology domain-containing family A member 5-like isoform X3 [Syngnathoides biaculeatus]